MPSNHQQIAKGMLLVMMFVVLAKLVAMFKEMAIAWRYGVGDVVDGYLFVFNLVSWPVGVWFGVLMVVLLPLASRLRHAEPEALPRFRAELLGLTVLLGVGLSLLAWLGLPVLIDSTWAGLAPGVRKEALDSASTLALLPIPGVLIGLFSAWMLSREQHANTLFEGLPALGILLAVLLFPSGDVEPLLWGTLAGMGFHLLALLIPQFRIGEVEPPCFGWKSPYWGAFWHGFGIMIAGQAILSVTGVIDQFFAAELGTGAISTLGYANRILALILGLGATAVGRATLPVFSRLQAESGGEAARHMALRWSIWMFLLGIPVVVAGWVLASWAVALLFERGAFTVADTAVVAEVLRYGLLLLPAYFAGMVLVSWLSSGSHYRLLLAIAVLSLGVKLAGNWVLVEAYGLSGVQLATAVMYFVSTLALLVVCWRRPITTAHAIS